MILTDGYNEVDVADEGQLLIRSKNSLLTINLLVDDPVYGSHFLFALNDERISHGQLSNLYEDDHPQYLDQLRHLKIHEGMDNILLSLKLNDLVDVQSLDPANKALLTYNGSLWIPARLKHSDLIDIDENDDHTQYLNATRHNLDSHNFYNEESELGNLPHDKLENLTDVNAEGIKNGQVLVKQGDFYVPADFPTQVGSHNHDSNYLKLDGTNLPTANLKMGNKRLTGLADSVDMQDAVTRYELISRTWKEPVKDIISYMPTSGVNGDRFAIAANAEDMSIRGTIIEYRDEWEVSSAELGNAFYNKADSKIYYWNGDDFVTFSGSGGTSDVQNFTDLKDVISIQPQQDQVYVVDANGLLTNKYIEDIIGKKLNVPISELQNINHVLFSDGNGGTFTNGIKTNEYDHLDINFNRIKNAIIDCGAYYG